MDFMVCAYGEPSEEKFIPFVEQHVAGIELQNYDRTGVLSEQGWSEVLEQHRRIASRLNGRLALHGPFAGIEYGYSDHLLRDAVRRRMDLTFEAVRELGADTLVLHTGCSDIMVAFGLTGTWLEAAAGFWKEEIGRYEACGARVVLENVVERSPEGMIALVDRVGSDSLGLCLDVGHANLCSDRAPAEWVGLMGRRLRHVHLHDNHGSRDEHLPVGQGTIDFDAFFDALYRHVPDVTVSLEVIDRPETVVENLVAVTGRFGGRP